LRAEEWAEGEGGRGRREGTEGEAFTSPEKENYYFIYYAVIVKQKKKSSDNILLTHTHTGMPHIMAFKPGAVEPIGMAGLGGVLLRACGVYVCVCVCVYIYIYYYYYYRSKNKVEKKRCSGCRVPPKVFL